jgi:hypothetical protein
LQSEDTSMELHVLHRHGWSIAALAREFGLNWRIERSWTSKMRTYTGPSVLVIDELGYLTMDATSAHWIFQVVSRRYERGSIVLTSNRGFGDWGAVFADGVVAGAILDRLLHHATVVTRQRPVSNGGRRYARLTSIASAPFAAISLHLPCSPNTDLPPPCSRTAC